MRFDPYELAYDADVRANVAIEQALHTIWSARNSALTSSRSRRGSWRSGAVTIHSVVRSALRAVLDAVGSPFGQAPGHYSFRFNSEHPDVAPLRGDIEASAADLRRAIRRAELQFFAEHYPR